MYLKLLIKECYKPKPVRLIMPAQKYEKISLMILLVIFGQLDALFTKSQHLILLSQGKTCNKFIER